MESINGKTESKIEIDKLKTNELSIPSSLIYINVKNLKQFNDIYITYR